MERKTLADEVNRLFFELITEPWQRPAVVWREARSAVACELQIPVGEPGLAEVSVTAEGRQVLVEVRRRSAAGQPEAPWRNRVVLPEEMVLAGVDTRAEDGVLHVIIRARRRSGERGRER
jgi:hypothetical protein